MKMLISVIVFWCLLLTGCASDPEMREKFGDGSPHIMVDKATGEAYVVEHNFGDTYTVRPLQYGYEE